MWPFTASSYPTRTPESVTAKAFDYIVVGGGTAGCVLASRLSENPDTTVLLLERGPVVDSWVSKVPLISIDFRSARSPSYKWTSAASALATAASGPPLSMVSGKALGGTSKINMHVYDRPLPAEFNNWTRQGRVGWSWEEVLPYFKRSEGSLTYKSSPHRGTEGPWKTRRLDELYFQHTQACIDASSAMGIPYTPYANDPSSPPVTCDRVDLTLDEHGRRFSTFDAFLPAETASRRRGNLFICTGAVVSKLDLEKTSSGLKAVGVYFQRDLDAPGGSSPLDTVFHVSVKREVVLCAGAIVSPQILLLSGIGPSSHLDSIGVPVQKDLPGVGSHLQDHLCAPVSFTAPVGDTMFSVENNMFTATWELLKFALFGTGLFVVPNPQVTIFASTKLLQDDHKTVFPDVAAQDSHLPENLPDIELMPIPYKAYECPPIDKRTGVISYLCVLLRPQSKGTVRLRSLDARERPDCDLAFLSDPRDIVTLRKAIRLALAMGRKLREIGYPARDFVRPQSESDEDVDAHIRKNIHTTYHYTSSCRMAPEAELGVVDDQLRVHGVAGLRIADSSIFPTIPASHLQAAAAMLGERCADFLKTAYQV